MKKIFRLLYIIILPLSQIWAGLITPENGRELTYIHVLFEWEEMPGSLGYDFQLSGSDDFNAPLISTNTCDSFYIEKDNISWQSSYYWRVRPEGGDWMLGEFSTGSPSYVFASGDVNPVEIQVNSSMDSDGITIYGIMDPFYSAAIDMNGNEVWNSGNIDTYMFSSVDNNYNFLGDANLPPHYIGELGIEFTIEDGIIWSQPTYGDEADFLQHELIKLPNGNIMGFVITYKEHFVPNSDDYPEYFSDSFDFSFENNIPGWDGSFPYPWTWKGERIVEWDENGNEVWSWDVFDYFDLNDFDFVNGFWEYAASNNEPFDWTHFNALAYDENENMIYVSSKNLSRITKINKNSGEIIWHAGRRWLGENNIIEPEEQSDRFSGQHGLQLLNNGNLVIFDNGISSGINDGTNIEKSRAMELKVSDILEVVWSYTLPVDLYGVISGNVQKLSNDNYLITTVGSSDGAHSLEVNNSGQIIWDCKYNVGTPQGAIYRAMRIKELHKTDESGCPAELGDVNGDGGWNVLDIVTLANCVLSENCGPSAENWVDFDCGENESNPCSAVCYGCAADTSGDGGWNVLDIVLLANCVLAQNCGN